MQQESFLNLTSPEVITVFGIKRITKILLLCAVVILTTGAATLPCMADEKYNDYSGYYMIIEDNADLLSEDEEDALFDKMEELIKSFKIRFNLHNSRINYACRRDVCCICGIYSCNQILSGILKEK